MKAIHTKQPNQVTNKDERISTRENPATTEQPDISCASFNHSSFMQGENDFAPRRANKLKEFFGLFSIHNKLPQTRGGGTSLQVDFSFGKKSPAKETSKNFKSEVNSESGISFEKETPTKKTSTIFETKVNSVSKIDNENSVPEFNSYHGKNKSTIKNYIKFNRNIRLVGSLSVIMLMFIATGIVVPYYIKSAETEAAGESHFGDALLTFTSESLSASVTLSNLAAGGSFATSTSAQQAKFSISTTNYTGYTLAIQAAEDTVLSGKNGGSLTAIPQSVTTAQYTANNIANVNLNNTWGFLPNYYKSGSNIVANSDTYLPISTTASTILDETTSANAEAKQYTISLGARADYTNTVDAFSNTFILQYIANPVNYAVTYDKNAGTDTVTNMPYENNTPQYVQAGHVEATSITLSNLIPLRNNYTFLGWCSEAAGAPVNNSDTCAGTIYNDQAEGATPNLIFNLSQTEANETTLYAMWHQELKTNISQLATMQDFASLSGQEYMAVLGSMTEGQSYQLKDSRDDKTYNIAKLKGGNVWLQDNLQLDIAAASANITSATTNANDTTLNYLKNGGGSSPYTTDAAVNTSASAWSGDVRYTKAMYNTEYADYDASYGNGTHKSGYYYNYCAASAGSYCYADGAGAGNATQDICPAGWQMPAGDTSTYSYQKLYEAYGSDYAAFKNALHVGLSGAFDSGIYGQGSYGRFWASTFYNTSVMRYLYVNASSVIPQNYNGRYIGFSVRCVLKPYAYDMQNVSAETMASILPTNGSTYIMKDNRDGTEYTIGKLNDKYWMLDNLALGGSSAMTLDSTNTNLADNTTYILPASGTQCFTNQNATCTGTDGTTTGNGYTVAAINADYKNATHKKDDSSATFTYNSNGDVSKAGVYYNYCAASAGTYCYAYNSAPEGTNAQYDICPKGWRLPTGGSDANTSEFRALANNLGNVTSDNLTGDAYTNFKAAFHAGLSGYFDNGSVRYQTSNVYFWSSTRNLGYAMYYLYLNTTTVGPQNSNYRYYGFSVRCVLKGASTSITFNGNGADSGGSTSLSFEAGSATLPSAETAGFANPRHAFLGWNTKADGSGTSYTAGTTITAEMNGLTLYAQWQEVTIAMQDLTYAACPATPTYVYDNRDNKVYSVQRLKLTTSDDNGLCWMLDNLQLDIAANKANITSANTNANDTALGYLKNGGGSSPYTTNAAANTNASTWSGDIRYTQAMYNTEYANYDASYGNGTHKSGYYYNYCAASAGSYCYAKSSAPSNTNATQDICPAGWQMPAGDTSTYSYQKLYEAYGSNAADFKNALHVGLSGYFNGGISNQGSNGYFWASTYDGSNSMRRLYVSASSVSPQNNDARSIGYSVRCVLK